MDPADPDILPPPRRPVRRRAGAVRAARVLVRQLDWLHRPVAWWGGPAPDAAPESAAAAPSERSSAPPWPTDAVSLIAARLRGRPRGAYAVRLVRAPAGLPAEPGIEKLLEHTAPTLAEVVGVDEALVARSLRRMIRARAQFPRALPKVVGDVDAWHAAAEAALTRVRPLIPPRRPTPAELLVIECSAVWLGPDADRPSRTIDNASLLALAADRGAPAFSRAAALVLGQRKVNAKLPPELREWHRCGRALASWPLDVLALAAEATGPEVLSPAAQHTALAGPRGEEFVREALLLGGAPAARRAVVNFSTFAAMIDRLCEEPIRRLGKVVAAQRDAVATAVGISGVHGPVTARPADVSPGRRAAFRLFEYAYTHAVEAAVAGKRFDPRSVNRHRRGETRPEGRPVAQLRQVLAAGRLWSHFLGDGPPDPAAFSSRIHWLLTDRTLDFADLPARGARLVWDAGEPALRHLTEQLRDRLWALTARLDVVPDPIWHAAAGELVERCCQACRPLVLADAHAETAFLALAPFAGDARSLQTVVSLADKLTAGWAKLPGSTSWEGARGTFTRRLSFIDTAGRAGIGGNVVKRLIRRGWAEVVDDVLAARPQRLASVLRWLRRLDLDDPPNRLAGALVLLEADVMEALLGAVDGLPPAHRVMLLDWAISFLTAGAMPRDFAAGRTHRWIARRVAFVRAAPPVLSSLPRFAPAHEKSKAHTLGAWHKAAEVAFAWFELGYADPAAAFDAIAAAEVSRKERAYLLLNDHVPAVLRGLVSLTRGRLDRLVRLNELQREMDYQQLDQAITAWDWLVPMADLSERLGALACGPLTGPRTIKVLARLGLCLRLHRGGELRRRLEPLTGEQDPPPRLAAALESLGAADDMTRDLRRLCAVRGGAVPRSVETAILRPATLSAELRALEASADAQRPAGDERRQRRIHNLRRYLDDPAALRAWVESDLRKLLPTAVDVATLDSAERLADGIVLSHAADVVGAAPPPGYDARNWDNALRLYFTTERNRGALRKLLRGEVRGDRTWVTEHPANRRFLEGLAARGVKVDAWTGPYEEKFSTPAGEWTVALETDPLHVLQMGNYFETCLGLDGCNAFATIANACEADKRVVYVRDGRGVVVGRKLLVMTPAGRIVGFRSYGAGALDEWEADDGAADGAGGAGTRRAGPGPWIKIVLDVFCRHLADHCGAKLHPLARSRKPTKDDPSTLTRGLFCHWYNDGPEAFDPPWLHYSPQRLRRQIARDGRARPEIEALLQGSAEERAAARRVLLWLGGDASQDLLETALVRRPRPVPPCPDQGNG